MKLNRKDAALYGEVTQSIFSAAANDSITNRTALMSINGMQDVTAPSYRPVQP